MTMPIKSLTNKHKIFCEEYLKDFNAKRAAVRAGYSEHTAQETGSRLTREPVVKEYLNKLLDQRSDEIDVELCEIVREFKRIAFDKTVHLNHRLRALENLAKYKKMWDENPTLIINNNVTENMTDEEIQQKLKELKQIEGDSGA